jgi:tetratricopeptide (TPR) repeat protein
MSLRTAILMTTSSTGPGLTTTNPLSQLLFRGKLAGYIIWFALQLGVIVIDRYRPHLISLLVAGFVSGWLLLSYLPINLQNNSLLTNPPTGIGAQASPMPTNISPGISPLQSNLYQSKELTIQEMDEELRYWLALSELQPTHRDILINISLLYQALGNQVAADEYWQRAHELDPNFSAFSQ